MTRLNPSNTNTRDAAPSRSRALCVGLTLAVMLVGRAPAEEEVEPPVRGLERVVFELEASDSISAESLSSALIAAGPRALEELEAALEGSPTATTVTPQYSLTPAQLAACERALAALPRWVDQQVDPTRDASRFDVLRVQLALEVLEGAEQSYTCGVALSVASPSGRSEPTNQVVVKSLEQTLSTRLLARPRDARELEELMPRVHPGLRSAIIRAVGDAPSTEAADFLAKVLNDDPSMDLMVLAQLGRVVAVTREPCDPSVEARVTLHLNSTNPSLRREACLVAGKLELFDCTGQLIDLLSDEDAGVRGNALWALERVTGKRMKAEPERWHRWHKSELHWWNLEASAAFGDLRTGEPHEVAAAIRELSGHRQFRHQITEELVLVLLQDEDHLVVQACAALLALRSGLAVPALRQALASESDVVRDGAWKALRGITGRLDLPADPAAWADVSDISVPR